MANHSVRSYCIVDVEQCLGLAQKYLGHVLDQGSFAKIEFVRTNDFHLLRNRQFHLCINIDSFAEIDPVAVHLYLRYIEGHCRYLYVKNPVGKYLDSSLDNQPETLRAVELALSTGLLRDIIDIYDTQTVEAQAARFVDVYCPGADWRCVASGWAPPWSWYWQALFRSVDG